MAENTDEEHVDTPANMQPENAADNNSPAADTASIPKNQETSSFVDVTEDKPQTMEVHKHPHHVTHKKKWGEYLLEFFMLFLAVFLGFVAENLREHSVESDRAKEFAVSLVQDLQNDTLAIDQYKKRGDLYNAAVDSLYQLSKTRLEGTNATKFSFYTRFMYWTERMLWHRATFEQIKNSGGLRYFKNYQLLQKLMNYNSTIESHEAEFENRMIRGNMLLAQINQVIEPELHHDLSKYRLMDLDTMSVQLKESFFNRNVASLEAKRAVVNEMLNMTLVQQRNILYINNSRLTPAKELAKELINALRKEFHLD